jgi:hypothetical protein
MFVMREVSFERLKLDFDFFHQGLEPVSFTSVALMTQRKLGTIIIQTVQILQHGSADTEFPAQGGFLHGQLKLLPNNLARQ